MKKGSGGGRRSTRRSSAAALLDTPPPVTSSSPSPPPPKSTLLNNRNKRTRKTTTSATALSTPAADDESNDAGDTAGSHHCSQRRVPLQICSSTMFLAPRTPSRPHPAPSSFISRRCTPSSSISHASICNTPAPRRQDLQHACASPSRSATRLRLEIYYTPPELPTPVEICNTPASPPRAVHRRLRHLISKIESHRDQFW